MTQPAAGLLAASGEAYARPDSPSAVAGWIRELAHRCARLTRRYTDHVRAKLAYHDQRRYAQLVRRALAHLGGAGDARDWLAYLRRADPRGLGVYLLAQAPPGPDLVKVCRESLRAPRYGPPRPITHLLEESLAGRAVSWAVGPAACDVLAAGTVVASALTATLTPARLVPQRPAWTAALGDLTTVASALQLTARVQRRWDETGPTAAGAANLVFQAANTARRAINRTSLVADEEHLAASAAGLALDAAQAACRVVVEWTERASARPDSARHRLAAERMLSLGRSVDALAARARESLHAEVRTADQAQLDQAARVLKSLSAVLRPWSEHLAVEGSTRTDRTADELCQQASAAALESAETLDAWSTIWAVSGSVSDDSSPAAARSPSEPAAAPWAVHLVRAAEGRWLVADVLDSIRQLARADSRVPTAAVCIAALPSTGRALPAALWDWIRSTRATPSERSLAFQLLCRMRRPCGMLVT